MYEGEPRVVEPHCHGLSHDDNEGLRGFQVSGGSTSGDPFGWKLFLVAEISGLVITDDVFQENRPHYNPNDKGMNRVCCAV